MNDEEEYPRGTEVIGTQDIPIHAWRGREGVVLRSSSWYGPRTYRIRWNGNIRENMVQHQFLMRQLEHREW